MDEKVLKALKDARDLAMEQCVKARVPECGEFATIAQDLDWAIAELTAPKSKTVDLTKWKHDLKPLAVMGNLSEPVSFDDLDWGDDSANKIAETVKRRFKEKRDKMLNELHDVDQSFKDEIALELLNECGYQFDDNFRAEAIKIMKKTSNNPWDIPVIVKILKIAMENK